MGIEPQGQKTTFYVDPQGQYPGQGQPNIGGGTTFNGPQGQHQDQAPRNIGGYTYYGSQGAVQGQQRRCLQDSLLR